ncbi:MAG: transposase [Elusimicrobia bacterium]|nr:transposase [Elusimicrobiota bacterium]
MARSLRIEYSGAIYHITSRGNAYKNIFNNDSDRELFLETLYAVIKRYNWLCHSYCLMDNHYHLLIETPDANLSVGMRQLNGVYTQKYNKRHKKCGHIFQGRFKAILVEKDNYILAVSRYIVFNPVRAGMVKDIKNWKWSSYPAMVGLEEAPEYLSVNWLLGQFGNNRTAAQRLYKQFVQEGINKTLLWDEIKGGIFLGSEKFIKKFGKILSHKNDMKEIPRIQRKAGRPEISKLLKKSLNKNIRNKQICKAYTKYAYTLKEIADYLNIHYTTVSKVVMIEFKK